MELVVDQLVDYTLSAYDARTIVEQGLADRTAVPAGSWFPARVVAVPERTVVPTADLMVQLGDAEYAATNRTLGDGAGYWYWPYPQEA